MTDDSAGTVSDFGERELIRRITARAGSPPPGEVWGGDDTARFEAALSGLHREIDRIGRDRNEVEAGASIACVLDGWREVEGGFREPEVAVGPAERIAEVIRDYAQAGAQHVILSLSPDPYAEIDPDAVEKAAKILDEL